MQNDKPDRPAWMNDEQYVIYRELRTISDKMFAALIAGDEEAWRKLTARQRHMARLADDKMFV
jgi:hypothetical protein